MLVEVGQEVKKQWKAMFITKAIVMDSEQEDRKWKTESNEGGSTTDTKINRRMALSKMLLVQEGDLL